MRHFSVRRFCYTAATILSIGVALLIFHWVGHSFGHAEAGFASMAPNSNLTAWMEGRTILPNEADYIMHGALVSFEWLALALIIVGLFYGLYTFFFPESKS